MSTKSKLALVISSLNSGGAERVVSNLANEFVNNFDVTIVCLYKCEPFYHLDNRISVVFCKKNYNPSPTIFQSAMNHFSLFKTLLKIIKKKNIEVSIGFMSTANIYLSLATKFNNVPCIISERSNPEHPPLSGFWKRIRQISYPSAQYLVVQTDSIKKYFESFINKEKIIIIKNPLANQLIYKRESYTSRSNIILNVGRLDSGKNQDLLIKAFSNIDHKDWKVLLVGSGELRSHYENLINSLHLNDKVLMVGNVDNIEDYYNRASIFVFTSRYEGFPNALTEAMFYGLPCISTDCPSGPSEIIKSETNGFLISVGDQSALEDKLTKLMADAELRQFFSKNAVLSTTEFLPESISELWEALINKCLN